MTTGARGPIETATAELAAWLAGAAGEPVPVGPPRPDDDGARLTLWPLELRAARQTRGSGGVREPYRFTVRYLLCAGGPAALPGLDRVLTAATAGGEHTVVLEAGDPRLWQAFGTGPRPALLIDVAAQVAHAGTAAPPVLAPLRLRQLELLTFDGRVVGPAEQPLAAVRVEVIGQPYATSTDPAGRFRMVGVPHDPDHPGPVRLRLTSRGQVLTAEVDPAEPDIVIVCPPPSR
ncbi:carboxypeptidase-like regulatory domain-containing protein [Micromonospora sp. C28SCA-DRY-2]|uniref:carboxypeptidase-like regulatory domain-containing protein n=1 Tax=Micromonospora sp. C28SCA-DRY-2 TaxID=3059522 RepID=UPI0026773463|nr:carboxypeptidase-like regulatory domain-containing protein [Micromonospora sp. C28SCA-DRY-2]MDO3705212.1 carboxypeptidase-like regulatory domain-containing protein [Micromonospora sp. C28SCA-DRY-2]